jgi:hypothetical protein
MTCGINGTFEGREFSSTDLFRVKNAPRCDQYLTPNLPPIEHRGMPLTKIHQQILSILESHPEGVTSGQLRKELGVAADEQAQLDRRRRELYAQYLIEKFIKDGDHYYRLVGKRETPLDDEGISQRLRAEVLRISQGRCQMCGNT